VKKGTPVPLSPAEPEQVAEAVASLGLRYAVVTSVTRDDLPDGGAEAFARTVKAIKMKRPQARVEVLVPDFQGSMDALASVIASGPDVVNHNLETTEPGYPRINRPVGNYRRSLGVLEAAKRLGALTKSGLMVGLGEAEPEIEQTFADLLTVGCDLLTIGQYLQPSRQSPPVGRYYSPEEFAGLRDLAMSLGFREVAAGPLVRSSYKANQLFRSTMPGGA
jgi:lipoic acid synthetase